jgi:hypothetical protein
MFQSFLFRLLPQKDWVAERRSEVGPLVQKQAGLLDVMRSEMRRRRTYYTHSMKETQTRSRSFLGKISVYNNGISIPSVSSG